MNCHSFGSLPAVTSKKCVPSTRSNSRNVIATVMNGTASTVRNAVTSCAQVKSVMREKVMPGARRVKIVTMKLRAPRIDESPMICRPRIQKSWPWLVEYAGPGSGGGEGPAAGRRGACGVGEEGGVGEGAA